MENMVGIRTGMFAMRAIIIFFVAALILAGTVMGEIPRNGLVGEWHFDGDAKDSSGSGNDGTIYGGTFADGKFGKALALNGGNSYADFGEGSGKLDFGTGPFSIEFWMNYQGTTVAPNVTDIMGKTLGNSNNPGYLAWTTTWGGDGTNYGVFIATTTASWGNGNAEHWGAYFPNTWYHIVLVRVGNTWTIYKNGENAHSETKAGMGLSVDNNANFKIGESTGEPNFKGNIDEVHIYNRALSPEEIKANYESGQIIITASPSGAEVLIDGQSKGNASPIFTVYGIAPGSHVVKCKLSGYSDYDTNVALTSGSGASINCALAKLQTQTTTGNISITSSPAGAEVLVDGASKGLASITVPNVSPGSHTIKCKLSGYADYDTTATVTAGTTISITCSMPQSNGNISITSSPIGAEVLVDGTSKGIAPLTVTNVSPGFHAVKCKLTGYADNDNSATVTAGSTSMVICSLVKAGDLSVRLTSEPASIQPGQISTIKITVTKDDAPVSGVKVMLTSSPNVKFSSSSGTTTNGEFISNFTASTEGEIKVFALAKKEGINDGKGETVVQVAKFTSPNASKQAAITGKVMDAGTDDPVQDVTITVEDKSAFTGSNGEYELSVDVGKHNLSASKQGYKTQTRYVIVPEGGTIVPDMSLEPAPVDPTGDKTLFWIAIILILLLAAAIGLYLWTKGNLELIPKQVCIPCDGQSTIPIRVQFTNMFKKPKRQGKDREVELETTSGKIQNAVIPTGKEYVDAILTSSNECGTVSVIAKSGSQKAKVIVNFISRETGIEVIITPSEIPADGKSTAAVTVKVKNESGNCITYLNEKTIDISTTLGMIISPVKIPPKSLAGITILTSGQIGGTAIVTAVSGSLKGEGKILFKELGKRYCVYCGSTKSMNVNNCPVCGKSDPLGGLETKNCKNCHEVISKVDGGKFCSACGAGQPE